MQKQIIIAHRGESFEAPENTLSSVKGYSSVLLRGNFKPNLQYTKLNSKSRIGSFGVKG